MTNNFALGTLLGSAAAASVYRNRQDAESSRNATDGTEKGTSVSSQITAYENPPTVGQ